MVWGGGLRVLGIEGCRALRLRVVEKSHLGVQGSGRGSGLLYLGKSQAGVFLRL